MRFTYLRLTNYIGIYNGMGLYDIEIDFSKSLHKICVIKGTNGSGKSTIMNALSLFPDGYSAFIPDKSAFKEVRVLNKGIVYSMKFYSDVSPSGSRQTTKAYISKMDANGNFIELNQNGNVTSYKDVLYAEFKLDANFFALAKLSMDDRGLGYKKPAERKKFVNSIIESLEVYNDIYKTVSKKANNVKVLMQSILSKLGSIGDKESLEALRISIETELKSLKKEAEGINRTITEIDTKISMIDPEGNIRETNKNAIKGLVVTERRLKDLIYEYKSENVIFIPEAESLSLSNTLAEESKNLQKLLGLQNECQSKANAILERLETIDANIRLINEQLSALKTDEYIEAENALDSLRQEAINIKSNIDQTGIDPNSFTKDEYILALETVHEIVSQVDYFRAMFSYEMIERAIRDYAAINYTDMPPVIDVSEDNAFIAESSKEIERYGREIAVANQNLSIASALSHRPDNCKIDECYFISDAVKAQSTNPQETLNRLNAEYEAYKKSLEDAKQRIEYANQYNSCINSIRVIIRSIDKNNAILSRLPNGSIFQSKAEFFERLVHGDSFTFIDKVYKYINLANYFDMYRQTMQSINRYETILSSIASKKESMTKFEEAKMKLKKDYDFLKVELNGLGNVIAHIKNCIKKVQDRINYIENVCIPYCDQIIDLIKDSDVCKKLIEETKSQMITIDNYIETRTEQYANLRVLEHQIQQKEKEFNDIGFKLSQIAEYENSLEQYKKDSELFEKLKYHSSPTTGIQLVFMELYMGKILSLSNTLLSYLFGGQYQLQPFVINEDEFRIPCIGDGYLNDDISSMSSSQLTMISMILSFALLAISSTEYDIPKLDEIDDPLDENNRAAFALLLDNIMDVMHSEQCIMISHSSEMITTNADIVLLRSDGLSVINENSNIIWNFEDYIKG